MSDIVERLREVTAPSWDRDIVDEAADAITRLRAEKAELVEALMAAVYAIQASDPDDEDPDLRDAHIKACNAIAKAKGDAS